MKTNNSGRTLMTPGLTAAPFSEAMPAGPKNGDEVIAVNLGSSVYTLTGSIDGGDVALDAGETAILVYCGPTGWVATWRSETGAVTYPISLSHGGTGADGTDLWAWLATDAGLDTAKTEFYLSATDSGANTFNGSIGIELPNSVGVAGSLVFRTGGAGASTPGTDRLTIYGTNGNAIFNVGDSVYINTTVTPSGTVALYFNGTDSGGNAVAASLGTLDSLDLAIGFGPTGAASGGPLFIAQSVGGSNPRMVFDQNSVYASPLAAVEVRSFADTAIFGNSLSGISALFQTSDVAGGNANPTVVVAGNTAQTAPLTEWRGNSGTSVLGQVLPDTGLIRIYGGGFTDVDNFDGIELGNWLGGNVSNVKFTNKVGGVEQAGELFLLGSGNNGGVRLLTGGAEGWAMNDSGTGKEFAPLLDNAYDLGIAATNRVRDGYFGGNVDAASYSVAAVPGITGTVTTASLVGKTLTFTAGLITGFA